MAQYGTISGPVAAAGFAQSSLARQPSAGWLDDLLNPQPAPAKLKVPRKDLLVFFRQLAVILQSGLPLAQGLDLLADNMPNKTFSICISQIAVRLSAGEELSSSLMQFPRVFSPLTVGLIQAGETGGILEQVLDRIANLMEAQAKLRGEIIGALVYPVLVLVLALSVSLALLIFIVPKFKDMFDGLGAELPALTSFMLQLSGFVTSLPFLFGAPLAVVTGLFLFRRTYSTKIGRLRIDSAIFKVPLFGDLILFSEMASFSDTLETLVRAGIPVMEGLERCINASSNQLIKNSIRRSIVLVEQGQELSYALGSSRVMPKLVIAMVKIGSETGQLAFMLENLAKFYKREVETTVSALTKAMEPAVIFVVAIIVGTIVISLYLPMFDMIQKIG